MIDKQSSVLIVFGQSFGYSCNMQTAVCSTITPRTCAKIVTFFVADSRPLIRMSICVWWVKDLALKIKEPGPGHHCFRVFRNGTLEDG